MKFIKFFTPLALILSITQASHAEDLKTGGLFVEPAITYETGTIDVNFPSPLSDSKEDIKGFGLGLRLGGHVYESLFLALDGRYSRPNYDSSAMGGSGSATAYNAGLTLGVQTPVAGLRVWGTYILTGNMDPEKIGSVDVKLNNLKGFRVGAGLYIATVSVNLEYQDAKYDSVTVEEFGPLSGNLDDLEGKNKSYILSVSFPISL